LTSSLAFRPSGALLNGPISGAIPVYGNGVVGNTLDANGTHLLIEISPTAGVVATQNVDTGAAGAIFGIVAVPKTVMPMGGYGSTNTKTIIIYFNDNNANTVKLFAQ
jgi:hypothetical protein